ncbi:S41 family peptidase [Undibacterium sp. Ji42W]|uniref:S41 family peptidase n=1 Tax=Undibacterium sp. Ji42W TaxID=3413039 RepID=UPI003BF419CB
MKQSHYICRLLRNCLAIILFLSAPCSYADNQPVPTELLRKFINIYGFIHADYVNEVDDKKLFEACYGSMLKNLDGRSAYIDAELFNELQTREHSVDASIGINIHSRAGLPYIIGIFDDSPASRAGLKIKDYILAIDDESTEEMDLSQVGKKLRGPNGSTIRLKVRHYGEIEERSLGLIREKADTRGAKSALLAKDIAYIRINEFSSKIVVDTVSAFKDLSVRNNSALKGLILDLRDSPGGILSASAEIAALFLQNEKLVYSSKGRMPEANTEVYAKRGDFKGDYQGSYNGEWPRALATIPVVVMVNEGTASGAEIVAAALKEYRRGLLIGRKTLGLGSIQTIRRVSPDTAAKLTTAYFTTPEGNRIQGNGVMPDRLIAGENNDAWISAAMDALKTGK